MTPAIDVLANTDWLFVVVCSIVSFVLGSLWFHKNVFGTLYCTWMKFPKEFMEMSKAGQKKHMQGALIREIISRVIFFVGLNWALLAGGRSDMSDGLVFVILVWLTFVVSTQLSQVTRSTADKRVVLLTGGKTLLDMLLAMIYWYMMM